MADGTPVLSSVAERELAKVAPPIVPRAAPGFAEERLATAPADKAGTPWNDEAAMPDAGGTAPAGEVGSKAYGVDRAAAEAGRPPPPPPAGGWPPGKGSAPLPPVPVVVEDVLTT
jgi:hypothetical protein